MDSVFTARQASSPPLAATFFSAIAAALVIVAATSAAPAGRIKTGAAINRAAETDANLIGSLR
jgi:hypothetical protein